MRAVEGGPQETRVFTPFPIELAHHFALNPPHDQQHATAGGARESFRRCAHDGWKRQFKEINRLEAIVRALCAVRE